jgi:hypothetical protein
MLENCGLAALSVDQEWFVLLGGVSTSGLGFNSVADDKKQALTFCSGR